MRASKELLSVWRFFAILGVGFGPYEILGGKNETYPIGDRRYGGSWFRQCIGG
jgi:hypothetical protein